MSATRTDSATKAKPTRRVDTRMEAAGYWSIARVAATCGVTRATVRAWIDGRHVKAIAVGLRFYVQRQSVVDHLGPEGAKILMAPPAKPPVE